MTETKLQNPINSSKLLENDIIDQIQLAVKQANKKHLLDHKQIEYTFRIVSNMPELIVLEAEVKEGRYIHYEDIEIAMDTDYEYAKRLSNVEYDVTEFIDKRELNF